MIPCYGGVVDPGIDQYLGIEPERPFAQVQRDPGGQRLVHDEHSSAGAPDDLAAARVVVVQLADYPGRECVLRKIRR